MMNASLTFEVLVNVVKMLVIFLMMVQIVPILVWVERRGSAFIQNRLGPNRIGPLGLTQLLADAVKFLFKEEYLPKNAVPLLYLGAPIMALIPGALAFNSIPLSSPIQIEAFQAFGQNFGPYTFLMQGYDFGIGIVFVLAISSLGAYSILMAGYGSANKFALMGALRASAQMVSYELALGLSLVGILLLYGTFSFNEMIAAQNGLMTFTFLGHQVVNFPLPNWGIFYQPLGALIFFAATFAESNRLPFDLPEAEGELVAGFHTEYGGMKFNMFFIGEYGHMMVACALMIVFYFGGFAIPWISNETVASWFAGQSLTISSVLTSVVFLASFLFKMTLLLWIFIWVRWTLPRFRYDQLMNLGWKTMLPWALFNTIATAVWLLVAHS